MEVTCVFKLIVSVAALICAHTDRCAPPLSPVLGTLKLVSGDGTSVGSVMSLQCPSRHRAVSGGQMACVWSSNNTHWSGGTPECKRKPLRNEHKTSHKSVCEIEIYASYNNNKLSIDAWFVMIGQY